MSFSFVHSLQSEWIKKRRSASSWLVLIGGFFIPTIVLIAILTDPVILEKASQSGHYWEFIYNRCWPGMGMFLLPMGVILSTSLITQLEFKNNTWKQLHATPQRLTTIFFAKLSVIVVMLIQFFVLFNIGMFLAGEIPLLLKGIALSNEKFPFIPFMRGSAKFFLDCLPMVALQYLISLQFKNFLVPVGIGLGLFIGSMIALSWKYCYLIPYSYCALNFRDNKGAVDPSINIHYLSILFFAVFTVVGYVLYLNKREKG